MNKVQWQFNSTQDGCEIYEQTAKYNQGKDFPLLRMKLIILND